MGDTDTDEGAGEGDGGGSMVGTDILGAVPVILGGKGRERENSNARLKIVRVAAQKRALLQQTCHLSGDPSKPSHDTDGRRKNRVQAI